MRARLFHLHTLSPLHCGTGQSADVVDLPIARARATNLPIVPGSSLRGVLRQLITDANPENAEALFGPATIRGDRDSFAGALSIGDAHLLVLPVRCLAGIVSYVSAPFMLRRYARDLARIGVGLPTLPHELAPGEAAVLTESVNLVNSKLVLEDLDLKARKDPGLKEWATRIAQAAHPSDVEAQRDFIARFALLPDSIMDFLAETATEIRTRVAINPETGIVRKGALWQEENLPAETLMWGLYAMSASNRDADPRSEADLLDAISDHRDTLLQLGGNAGVGHGLARFLIGGVD